MAIVLADGHTLFADLLRRVLEEQGHSVVAVARNAEELILAIERHSPRIVVINLRSMGLEIDLANAGGRRALLHRAMLLAPSAHVVVLDDENSDADLVDIGMHGHVGFLSVSGGLDDLLAALLLLRAGKPFGRRSSDGHRVRPSVPTPSERLAASLTAREQECLCLLVDGAPTARIVVELGISVMTVRSHIQSIFYKLDVHSRLEAAALAVRHGLVPAVEGARSRTG